MKVGETIAVNIGQAVIQQAKITEIDTENSLVTLVVPATKVVMSYRTELDTTPVAPPAGKEHAILGLENEVTQDAPVNETLLAADAVATEVTTPDVAATPAETPVAAPVENAPVVAPQTITPVVEPVVVTE